MSGMLRKSRVGILDIGALVYLSVPLLMFIWGWLKPWIAIPLMLCIVYSLWKLAKERMRSPYGKELTSNLKEWIPSLLLFVMYIFVTGMTGNWAQHTDYYVRNDIFWDLTTKSWPPNLPDGRYFIYYFQSWLPAALVGSFFGWQSALWSYFIWTVIGMIISLCYIFKAVGKCSFWIACVFFVWNGLELIPCSFVAPFFRGISIHEAFMQNDHVAGAFLTESPSFSIKNIVHCFVPLSIIGGMLLQPGNVRKIGVALGVLAVMYSPMSALFLLPILLYFFVKEYAQVNSKGRYILDLRCMMKETCSVCNISYILPFLLLVVPFYAGAEALFNAKFELLFEVNNVSLFLFYLFFNAIVAVMLIRRNIKSNFVWVVFVTHSLCVCSGLIFHGDIAMKGSVVTSYFLIILYCQAFEREKSRFKLFYIIYSLLGAQYFVHMTGALQCVVVAIGIWLLLRLNFWKIMVVSSAITLALVVINQLMPTALAGYKDKLAGKYVKYHDNIGIYQEDGGSGLWWWYRSFPDKRDMPAWFKNSEVTKVK